VCLHGPIVPSISVRGVPLRARVAAIELTRPRVSWQDGLIGDGDARRGVACKTYVR
jgi:hypothetical protein